MRRTRRLTASISLLAAVTTVMVAGCARQPTQPAARVAVPFAACPSPAAPSPSAAGPPAASSGGQAMPDVSLTCMAGGADVALARLGRPAVVNLWASWCPPCRAELPSFESYANKAGDRVEVLGVVTSDTAASASSLGHSLGLTFPAVFDGSGTLLAQLGRSALPLTLFVGADGHIRHIYAGPALDEPTLAKLAHQYLNVAVPK